MYFNSSEILRQSYFNGASWKSSPSGAVNPPWTSGIDGSAAILPFRASPDSSLSISTNIIPPAISGNDSTRQFNNSFESPNHLLSSVAVYQTDSSVVMVDLVGNTWKSQSPHIGAFNNLFSQFMFSPLLINSTLTATSNVSLLRDAACMYNKVQDLYPPLHNTYRVPLSLVCVSPHLLASALYGTYELGQAANNIWAPVWISKCFSAQSTISSV